MELKTVFSYSKLMSKVKSIVSKCIKYYKYVFDDKKEVFVKG